MSGIGNVNMRFNKLNGRSTPDSESDGGSAAEAVQQRSGVTPAGALVLDPVPPNSLIAPEFEEIVDHVPIGDAGANVSNSAVTASSTSSTLTTTYAGSGLVFNNTFGSGASQAFINDVVAAENYLQSEFTNVCTVNCSFDVQSLNPNFEGENSFNPITVTYPQFVKALQQHATTPTAQAAAAALANLPDPSHGASWEIPIGEARILGLAGPGSGIDDSVVLNSYYWTGSALQNDADDAEAVIEHELTEGIMGRIGSLGIADSGYWAPMDLFRFTASGQRDFTGGTDGRATYFSVDGSNVNTGLHYHNSVNSSGQFDGFDLADWDAVGADANATDPFGPGGPNVGDPGTLSATDIQILQALGWSGVSSPSAPPPPAPVFVAATVNVGNHPSGYSPTLVNDFNNDGTSDVLWYNSTSHDVDLWEISNGSWAGSVDVGSHPAGYQPVASGDFNHDGTSDVLWYNPTTHDLDLWEISNGHWAASVDIGTHPTGYTVAGAGDFNHDGTSDVLWYNPTTHDIDLWQISNGHWAGSVDVGSHPAGYTIAGIGDFNGDGTSDVLWYNSTTNDADLWEISNGHWAASVDIGSHPAGYTIAGVGDFNHDGTSDIVWSNATTNDVDIWEISNGHWAASADLGTHSAGWTIAGTGDFNHDGISDILWYQPSTNATQTWLLGESGSGSIALGNLEPVLRQGSSGPISDFQSAGVGTGNGSLTVQQTGADAINASTLADRLQSNAPDLSTPSFGGSLIAPEPADNSGLLAQAGAVSGGNAVGNPEPDLAQLLPALDLFTADPSDDAVWQSGPSPAYSLANFAYIGEGTNSGAGGVIGWLTTQQVGSVPDNANSAAGSSLSVAPNPSTLGFAGSLSAPAPGGTSGMIEEAASPMISLTVPHHT